MIETLIIWTMVACAGHTCHYDWRPLATFGRGGACEKAARALGLAEVIRPDAVDVPRYKCVTDVGDVRP